VRRAWHQESEILRKYYQTKPGPPSKPSSP